MKTYSKIITWCIIFLCFTLFISLFLLRVTGAFKVSWLWVIMPLAMPCLYVIILITYGIWFGYRAIKLKTPVGTLKSYDVVNYNGGNHPNEVGFLVKHSAIWVVEYVDGSQTYVEDLSLLKRA